MGAPWAGDSIVGATEGSTIIAGPGCPDPDSRMLAAEDGCWLEMLELEQGALERDRDEAEAVEEAARHRIAAEAAITAGLTRLLKLSIRRDSPV